MKNQMLISVYNGNSNKISKQKYVGNPQAYDDDLKTSVVMTCIKTTLLAKPNCKTSSTVRKKSAYFRQALAYKLWYKHSIHRCWKDGTIDDRNVNENRKKKQRRNMSPTNLVGKLWTCKGKKWASNRLGFLFPGIPLHSVTVKSFEDVVYIFEGLYCEYYLLRLSMV